VAAGRRGDDLSAKLKDAEARVREYRDKLAEAEASARGLEKEMRMRSQGLDETTKSLAAANRELDASRRRLSALEDEKKGLIAEADRVRAAADNRFAGIQLTGKRVVFLIDMSGSMEYVDEKTLAPEKWSGVRETLAKIMRSLPNLEKFQVILFSDKVTYLIGDGAGWLDYDGQSTEQATAALKKIAPKGGTNMYAAFEAAFRFRPQGLDTVYLLSDGLPNMGEGLSDDQAKRLKETEQAEILGKYVRQRLVTDWNREIRGQGRVRINAVGFFYESPDVGAFLWALTRENEGSFVGMSKP
jgi:Mg-chelatase subunit ChlD